MILYGAENLKHMLNWRGFYCYSFLWIGIVLLQPQLGYFEEAAHPTRFSSCNSFLLHLQQFLNFQIIGIFFFSSNKR